MTEDALNKFAREVEQGYRLPVQFIARWGNLEHDAPANMYDLIKHAEDFISLMRQLKGKGWCVEYVDGPYIDLVAPEVDKEEDA